MQYETDQVADRALRILRETWGYDDFRDEQAAIIAEVVAGRDALVIMPTGGGKSLCYQIPALIRDGVGVVVSPLIALMQDQVSALSALGVRAAFLNSSLSLHEVNDVERQLRAGEVDLLYVAPERLLMSRTLALLAEIPLALLAIDEAHCVSQWGHDFRPEYMQLAVLAERFAGVPRIALTATADARTRDEIVRNLQLHEPRRFVAGFDRPNIRYAITTGSNGKERLWQFLQEHHKGEAGIVYCLSRAKTESVAEWFSTHGREAVPYHAGLSAEQRRETQARFLREDSLIVVATIAFGMGIDKPDVRFVAHLNLPKSIEAYYQETGRAGRDGAPANAWLHYDLSDVVKLRQWIEQSEAPADQKRVEWQKLDALLGLCEITTCRRQALLGYFGETDSQPCGNCDNCLSPPDVFDGTELAQKALSAVYRTGQRFGAAHVIDVLRGGNGERIRQFNHDQLAVYGLGKDLDAKQWRAVFRQLVAGGLLAVDIDGYGGLRLTADSKPILRGETKIALRREAAPIKVKKERQNTRLNRGDQKLFDALRAKRKDLADETGVPPYVVFHDSTLLDMVAQRPTSADDFAGLSGVGAKKLEQYAQAFIDVINVHPRDAADALPETAMQTLNLFRDGVPVTEIATRRDLTIATVLGHLAQAIALGLVEASAVVDLPDAEVARINAVIQDHATSAEAGESRLKPVFEALGGEYDYGVLRCLRAASFPALELPAAESIPAA